MGNSFKPVVADLDGNGLKEIVISYKTNTSEICEINILNYDGSQFSENWPVIINHNLGITNITVGDIDGNGDLEIATIINRNEFIVYNYDASIVCSYPLGQEWEAIWGSPVISDLDFDNNSEIIFLVSDLLSSSARLYVLNSQGNILPGWPINFDVRTLWMSPVVGNFDLSTNSLEIILSDGHLSTIVHCFNIDGTYAEGWPVEIPSREGEDYTNNEILYYDDEGCEVYSERDPLNGVSPITVVDLNNDNDLEIIVTGLREMHILNHDGSYYLPFSELIVEFPLYSPAVGDVDSDGSVDIIFMTFENNVQMLNGYDNCGNILDDFPFAVREFQENPDMIRSRTNTPTLDDIDLDGDLEIMVTAWLDTESQTEAGGIFIYDVLSEYNIQKMEWRTALKNNWNNGIYCQYAGNLIISNSEQHQFIDRTDIYADLTITDNSSLYVNDNTIIRLLDNAQLIIDETASLNIGNNVVFIGETKTILKDPPFIPETIPGNRIEIYGSITIGTGVEFTVEDDEYWDGLYLLGDDDVIITDGLFNHCDLENKLGNMEISVTDFSYSHLINNSATLEIEDCEFEGFDSGTGIYCYDNSQVSISDSDIHDYNTGIKLYSCSNYEISDCAVYDNLSHGIFINDSYTGTNLISYSNIYNNSGDGIRFYTSKGTVESCYINNNSRGLFCYHTSVIELLKDPNTEPWTDDSIITDNDLEEILFVDDCVILMDQNRNMIIDNNISGGYDQYLSRCPDMNYNQVWRYNYWGYDGHFGATLPPEDRFYPACINPDANETGYVLSSVWDPGIPGGDGESLVKALYNDAGEALAEEDSVLADQLFKEVITQYPETEYAIASAKRLLEANSDYEELQDYYITEPNLHYNADIDNYANYLANYCNIKLEDYEEAILSFEEIITNPPSEIDSVMAIIDIGYTYLVMEENRDRAGFVGNMTELKPESLAEFEQNQEDLLANLLENPADYQDNTPSEDIIPEFALLYNNYPNPFNPETTISFYMPDDGFTSLIVYNIKGEKVATITAESLSAGNHNFLWQGKDDNNMPVSSGIYFYQLITSQQTETRKMILLK